MKNKKGETCVEVCILIIVFCMILSVMISFVTTVELMRQIRRDSQTVLDGFVMKKSVLIYNSIKNGEDEVGEINETEYISDLCEFCSFRDSGEMLEHIDEDDECRYSITKPKVEFSDENENAFQVTYTVKKPLYFCRVKVSDINVKIIIDSKFNKKYRKESFD